MTDLHDLHDLVANDPLPHARPDIASLIRHGRRLQHRRRAAYGAAGVAAMATVAGALGAGHALGHRDGGDAHTGFADTSRSAAPKPHHPEHSRSATPPANLCPVRGGIFVCEQPPRERRTPLGDVVPIGHRTEGSPEVL